MPIYVDGYNLIFAASRRMEGFDITRTEAARDNLLGLLAKFRTVHSERITVFFDGGPEAAHLPRRALERGMEIVFSDAKSDADSDIKYAVSHHENPRSIRVITSDAAIQGFVKRYGAQVTDSSEFLNEIAEALDRHALPPDEPMEKYEGTPPDEVDYWMGVFGAGPEGDGDG